MQGLGMMLSEDVKVDLTTGRLLSDSTWSYKVPSAGAKLPRQLCLASLLRLWPGCLALLTAAHTPLLWLSIRNEVDVCAGADTIPREMHVHLLKNSPHARGILSSKAVGEPPLLLACSALSAVQV